MQVHLKRFYGSVSIFHRKVIYNNENTKEECKKYTTLNTYARGNAFSLSRTKKERVFRAPCNI